MRSTRTAPPARVRVTQWPRQPDIAHLVLIDHHMIPDHEGILGWLDEASAAGARLARTNALFPEAAEVFGAAGFCTADTLSLLELDLASADIPPPNANGRSVARLWTRDLDAAADVDQRAFPDSWSNDVGSLDAIRGATPHHRSRVIRDDDRIEAFAISGRSGTTGYVQRLGVDPGARRRGHARLLLADALTWMRRRSVTTVLVNTAQDNVAALSLYRSFGFCARETTLRIMEQVIES